MAVIYSVQILVFKLVKLAAKYNISEIQKASLKKISSHLVFAFQAETMGKAREKAMETID